jgi:hypothetical protein
MSTEWERGFQSNQPKENFAPGSHAWQGAEENERQRRAGQARQAWWEQQQASERAARQRAASAQGVTTAQAATSADEPVYTGQPVDWGAGGGLLEGGILSCVALYRTWPQYLSLYSSFPRLNGLEEYVAAGLVLLSAICYWLFCCASGLFTWGSFIVVGALLAAWSLPWGPNWRTCLAGFLVFIMFLYRRALRSEAA